MPSITFVGVELKNCVRTAKEATFHFAAEYTAKVGKAFEWGDLNETCKKFTLDGSLAGGTMVLEPKETSQKTMDGTKPDVMSVSLTTCDSFTVTRLQSEGSKGKGIRRRIDFCATSIDSDACMKAEKWLQLIGKMKASLCCEYRVLDTGAPNNTGSAVDVTNKAAQG